MGIFAVFTREEIQRRNLKTKLTSATLGTSNCPGSPRTRLGGQMPPDPMARDPLPLRSNLCDPMSRMSSPTAKDEPNMVV